MKKTWSRQKEFFLVTDEGRTHLKSLLPPDEAGTAEPKCACNLKHDGECGSDRAPTQEKPPREGGPNQENK